MKDFANLVRVGKVSAVDQERLRVRVYFPQLDNLVSDWLSVLQFPRPQLQLYTTSAGSHTHGDEVSSGGSHRHNLEFTLIPWMPSVDNLVLVLYTPGFSVDGYVLGVVP